MEKKWFARKDSPVHNKSSKAPSSLHLFEEVDNLRSQPARMHRRAIGANFWKRLDDAYFATK